MAASKLGRGLIILITILLVVSALGLGAGILTVRRSFPVADGSLKISGLTAPVDIYRDEFGVPQVFAANLHDLFFAQGYVHAQDRFWQMDFWRHLGAGRLSEMFGEDQVDTDLFLRTSGGSAWLSRN